MHLRRRTRYVAVLLLAAATSLGAQSANLSGHWEGSIKVPGMELRVEIDLAAASGGALTGTMSIPSQNVKGLPFLNVAVEGKSVTFNSRDDQVFKGTLSANGQALSGILDMSGFTIPFSLARTGDPKIEPLEKSPPIGKELEGTWNAKARVKGAPPMQFVLTLSNQPDGTASGALVNVEEGGLRIPVTITQQGANVTLQGKAVGSTYSGALNAEGMELAGTYTQGSVATPLTFRRAAAIGTKK